MTTTTGPRADIDYRVVRALQAQVGEAMRAERRRRDDEGTPLTRQEEPAVGRALIARTLGRPEDDLGDDAELAAAVHDEMFGAGRLQPIIDDPRVVNIDVNGPEHVEVTLFDGTKIAALPVADSDDDLIRLVRRIATYGGAFTARPFDEAHPTVVGRLPGGHRFSAIGWVCGEQPSVSIRCVRPGTTTLADLQRLGDFTAEVGSFLEAAVRARLNLIVSGATLTGKTTMLRALAAAIPDGERLFTFEDFRELGLRARRRPGEVVELEARPANSEGSGAVPIGDLVRYARQQNPGRLIVGEILHGRDVRAMLNAMTQGENGSLSTIHASSSQMVFERLADYAHDEGMTDQACYRRIAGALHFVVHLDAPLGDDGNPCIDGIYVASIREVVGYDGTQVTSSEVFATDEPGTPQRPVAQITAARARRLAAVGYDPAAWPRR